MAKAELIFENCIEEKKSTKEREMNGSVEAARRCGKEREPVCASMREN